VREVVTVAKRLHREHPANVVRDRMADEHDRQEHVVVGVEGGRWPNVGRVGWCAYCAAVAHAEQNSVAAALADIFAPRAAGWTPRGFLSSGGKAN
jgi:hypothetical protein